MHTISLTVYFDDPFWVGVVERQTEAELQVTRHVFGAEPGAAELWVFVLHQLDWTGQERVCTVQSEPPAPLTIGPKRVAREAARLRMQRGCSTKAQQALQQQHEQHKQERKQRSKAAREVEEEQRWQVARQRAKARHRGR